MAQDSGGPVRRVAAAEIDRLLAWFEDEDPDVVDLRDRARRYATECGCSTGGVFLVVAALAAPVVLTLEDAWNPVTVLWSLLVVAGASLAGKASGMVVATARLQLLRRSLERRTPLVGGERCPPVRSG